MSQSTKSPATETGTEAAFDWWTYTGPAGVGIAAVGILAFVAIAAASGLSASPAVWYIARAAGITTYLLLWLSVVSGLAMSMKLRIAGIDQPLLMPIHRLATELSLAFLVLHMASMAVDATVALGMGGVLIPFMSSVRQPWTDLGIISAYLLVGIAASFGVRNYIGSQVWRRIHYLTFPLWLIALVHGIGAGTDTGTVWGAAIYIATADVVLYLTTVRLLSRPERGRSKADGKASPAKATAGATR